MALGTTEGMLIGLGVVGLIAIVATVFQFPGQSAREHRRESINRYLNMLGGGKTRKSKSGDKKTKRR